MSDDIKKFEEIEKTEQKPNADPQAELTSDDLDQAAGGGPGGWNKVRNIPG